MFGDWALFGSPDGGGSADLSWRYLATAPCSVVLKGDDRCEFVNFAVGPVAPAGLKTLEVKLPEAQQRNAFHSVFEIGQACCGRRFQPERVLLQAARF